MEKQRAKITTVMLVALLAVMFALPAQAATAKASDYAAVFDSVYYADQNPDLRAAFGNNEGALLNHFIAYGMAEGRQGNAEFNVQYYKANYADLQAAYGENLVNYYMHYIVCGKAEGRIGNGTASTPGAVPMTAGAAKYANEVLAIVNRVRAENGLGALSTTPELMNTAQLRAMETVTLFSHTRPNGSSCFTAFEQNGVSYRCAGENIAAGQPTAESVMNSWFNSPGHRANILNGSFTRIGIGCYQTNGGYGIYWAQCFTG